MSEKADEIRNDTRDEMIDEMASWMVDMMMDMTKDVMQRMTDKMASTTEFCIMVVGLHAIRNAAQSFDVTEKVAAEKLGFSVEWYEKIKEIL